MPRETVRAAGPIQSCVFRLARFGCQRAGSRSKGTLKIRSRSGVVNPGSDAPARPVGCESLLRGNGRYRLHRRIVKGGASDLHILPKPAVGGWIYCEVMEAPSNLKPWDPLAKVALVGEILVDYAHCWKNMRRSDPVEMVRAARDVNASKRFRIGPPHSEARRLGRVVGRVLGVLPTDSRCLIRSLVVTRVLARRGIPSRLVIGVRSKDNFEAHAWVEHEGLPILPPGEFTRLGEL